MRGITIIFVLLSTGLFGQIGTRCPVCPPSLNGVTNGWVLTDSSGQAVWQVAGGSGAGNFWKTTGNASTTAGTNFIGTTDNTSLVFKTNSVERFRLYNNGNALYSMDPRVSNFSLGDGTGSVYFGDVGNDIFSIGSFNFDQLDFNSKPNSYGNYFQFNGGTANPDLTQQGVTIAIKNDTIFDFGYAINMTSSTGGYSNIFVAAQDSSRYMDMARISTEYDSASGEIKAHGVVFRSRATTEMRYNGWDADQNYSQIEFNKIAEDGQATGNCFTLDDSCFGFWVSGSKTLRIDTFGNIIPEVDSAVSLGTASKRFKDLYVTGGSAHIGNAHITDSGWGNGKFLATNGTNGTWRVVNSADISDFSNTVKTTLSGLATYTTPTDAALALGAGKPYILSTTIGVVDVLLLSITP